MIQLLIDVYTKQRRRKNQRIFFITFFIHKRNYFFTLHLFNTCFHCSSLLCDTKNESETKVIMYDIIFEKNVYVLI